MGQFILNGRNYSGLTYAHGVFIDTDNVIKAQTTIPANTTATYTATEDCYLLAILRKDGDNASLVYIDGEQIGGIYTSTGYVTDLQGFFIKKGQVVTITVTSESHYTVYGIQQGSPVTFLSEYASACYDTTEREVGCWIDGKPLYQKTVHLSSVASGTAYSHGIANVENISVVNILAKRNTGWFSSGHIFEDSPSNVTESFSVIPNATYLYAYLYGCTISDAYITVQYTKTTDVAGSGKLTPTAMPTVHYDGNEKIIGTWFGETLYQKTWDFGSNVLINSNTWTNTSIDVATNGIKAIVDSKAVNDGGSNFNFIGCNTDQTYVQILQTRNSAISIRYLTLTYTKTT